MAPRNRRDKDGLVDLVELGAVEAARAPHPVAWVYGVVLNSRTQRDALKDRFAEPPYAKAPAAPVLYIKPPGTWMFGGGRVTVPAGVERLEVNGALAVMFGRETCRVASEDALASVAAYGVAIDVSIPHESLYRPAVRQRCRDGFLPIGRAFTAADAVADPAKLETVVAVGGREACRYRFDDLYRPLPELIAEISAFLSFQRGDVLLVGLAPDGATAAAGDKVIASISGVGQVACRLEPAA